MSYRRDPNRNAIIVSVPPRGRYLEGEVAESATIKPGTAVSLKSDGTYEPWNGAADGERDEVIIAIEDALQGRTVDDAYTEGERMRMYIPAPGDELQVLVADVAGTADSYTPGQKLIITDGTGLMKATTGTPEMEPFKMLEDVDAPTANTLVLVRATGV